MKNLTLKNIANAVKGTLFLNGGNEDTEILGVVTDNRQVEKDYLFIPIKGAKVDGHSFIESAFEAGAAVVFSEQENITKTGPYILVESSEQALKDLAAFYRSGLSIPIVGVIGSVGKTSTKEMLSSVLSTKYKVLKTQGNFNNEIGMPLTLLKIRDDHEVAVVEMGISDFNEMHRLGSVAVPDIVVMTNIKECHLENLNDRDGVLRAKTEVFEHLAKDASVVLNGNDDKLITVKSVEGAKVYYAGLEDNSFSVFADEIEDQGMVSEKAHFHTEKGAFYACIPLPGKHHVSNAALATQVGLILGLSLEEIKAGIEGVETIAGRNNFLDLKDEITVIDDCYNANPASMKASLSVLSHCNGRSIAVLGDMGELGSDEKNLHFGVGKAVVENKISVLFAVGELSKEIFEGAKNGETETHWFATKEEMLPVLKKTIKKGDTILVKASHFMEFPKVVEELTSLFS
ncbi:MAG: UDP-N-acetylmuramoyl-tripeptide--D-alanyl-D-alanine ligase [Lachnospiraceae bacterium]|nr:UDP-N-acetylmuramoyl-tripeptide--D-alanyl-D-alanine ligase [Lachnospiraceae bacterium]